MMHKWRERGVSTNNTQQLITRPKLQRFRAHSSDRASLLQQHSARASTRWLAHGGQAAALHQLDDMSHYYYQFRLSFHFSGRPGPPGLAAEDDKHMKIIFLKLFQFKF
jgi:hypothetical protein